jgi:hypothetical protein
LDQAFCGLKVVVVFIVPPVVVHGDAGFPVNAGKLRGGDLLLGCAEIAAEFPFLGESFHAGSSGSDAVIDDDIRLQGTDKRVEIAAVVLILRAFPLAIEPQDTDISFVSSSRSWFFR